MRSGRQLNYELPAALCERIYKGMAGHSLPMHRYHMSVYLMRGCSTLAVGVKLGVKESSLYYICFHGSLSG